MRRIYIFLAMFLLAGIPLLLAQQWGWERIEMVSINSSGEHAGVSASASTSADGRFVVFASHASNLVPNDTNNMKDIFVRDLVSHQTTRVSLDSNGNQVVDGHNLKNYEGGAGSNISEDGRFIVFIRGYGNEIVLRDLETGQNVSIMRRMSQVAISGNGRVIAAIGYGDQDSTNPSTLPGLYVYDQESRQGSRVLDLARADSSGTRLSQPSLSEDGRFIAFHTLNPNLVSGDNNNTEDVFVYDREQGRTILISTDPEGHVGNHASLHPSLSGNGRFVAFGSEANNLFRGDNNGLPDIFIRDLQTNVTTLYFTSSGMEYGSNPSLSANGRYVAYWNYTGVIGTSGQIYVYDLERNWIDVASKNLRLDLANGPCKNPFISGDGSTVVFHTLADNLVPNDIPNTADVFATKFTAPPALQQPKPQPSPKPPPPPPPPPPPTASQPSNPYCTDSDGGDRPQVRGTVEELLQVPRWRPKRIYKDRCLNQQRQLEEFYCSPGGTIPRVLSKTYRCRCEGGACTPVQRRPWPLRPFRGWN